jgi:D-3-phosphoglycerate dehydrogenase
VATRLADWSQLGSDVEVVSFQHHLPDIDTAVRELADFDVLCLMRERMAMPRALIERLPRLKFIAVTGSHARAVDAVAAAARGIPVSLTSRAASSSAAELAWALVLACARHVTAEDRNMREGRWQTTVGIRLAGRTLGLLGLGTLGSKVAEYGCVFGMTVIAWSANLTPERAAAAGARAVSKEDLLRDSDILSIHTKLSARTRGLIGAAELALMKPSAILINTSRGPIVDEAALSDALRAGRIAGAGLDVYDHEPLPPDDPLRSLPNTVLTPHVGFVTEEGYRNFFEGQIELIQAWRAGRPMNVASAD